MWERTPTVYKPVHIGYTVEKGVHMHFKKNNIENIQRNIREVYCLTDVIWNLREEHGADERFIENVEDHIFDLLKDSISNLEILYRDWIESQGLRYASPSISTLVISGPITGAEATYLLCELSDSIRRLEIQFFDWVWEKFPKLLDYDFSQGVFYFFED